jgi:hypothetical protein
VHLPNRRLIPELRTALPSRYPETGATHIRADDCQTHLHDSGCHGSTLHYMLGNMSPQAWWALNGKVRRRRARAPFVGKRYFITANISEPAQHAHYDETKVVKLGAWRKMKPALHTSSSAIFHSRQTK